MKSSSALLAVLLVLAAWPVLAQPPMDGEYWVTGRYTESYVEGSWWTLGNTVHAQSWEDGALGLLWEIRCPALAAQPTLIEIWEDENGYGWIKHFKEYSGGTFWLSGEGPWGMGGTAYQGTLERFIAVRTMRTSNMDPTGPLEVFARFAGYFDEFDMYLCGEWGAGVGGVGVSFGAVADYPVFLDSPGGICGPNPTVGGEYGEVSGMLMISNEEMGPSRSHNATWGSIKSMYR